MTGFGGIKPVLCGLMSAVAVYAILDLSWIEGLRHESTNAIRRKNMASRLQGELDAAAAKQGAFQREEEALVSEMEKIRAIAMAEIEDASTVELLQREASSSVVDLSGVRFEDRISRDFYTEYPVSATADGNLDRILEFLSKVEKWQSLATVGKLEISVAENGGDAIADFTFSRVVADESIVKDIPPGESKRAR